MTVLIYDQFSGTFGDRLDGTHHPIAPTNTPGNAWVEQGGGIWEIDSDGASAKAFSADQPSPVLVDAGVSDCVVTCTLKVTNVNAIAGLGGRGSDGGNYWYFWLRGDANKIELIERVGGANTTRGSASYTVVANTPMALTFTFSGTSVTADADGHSVTWGTSSPLDANMKFGCMQANSGFDSNWKDFKVTVGGGGGGGGGGLLRRLTQQLVYPRGI
jgi:hypothetical protein